MKIKTTRFGYLAAAHDARVGERELPEELGPNEVLVHMTGQNLCTTDYQQWMGLREHQGYPMAGGHEGAGYVVEVGSAVKTVKEGDFIALGHNTTCGVCPACRIGDITNCINPRHLREYVSPDGYHGEFGFAQYKVVPERTVYPMNPNLSAAEAGFLEPIATVVKGIEKLHLQPHETCLVVGAGTMGLCNAQVARSYGARVFVSELMENKLEAARNAGFPVIDSGKEDVVARVKELTDGKGVDTVILAVANKVVLDQSLEVLRRLDGRVLIFAAGYPAPKTELDSNLIHYRRIEIIGTYNCGLKEFEIAAQLLNTGAVDVKPMCEPETFDLDHIQDAFAAASVPGKFRVHVEIPE